MPIMGRRVFRKPKKPQKGMFKPLPKKGKAGRAGTGKKPAIKPKGLFKQK